MLRWLAPLALLMLFVGCSTRAPEEARREEEVPAKPMPRPAQPVPLSKEAQRALAKRGIQPHNVAPLTVASACSHVDEVGTATKLALGVDEGAVGSFDADVSIKGRGRCHFALADFRQEAMTPQVLLRHASDSKCTVRMWREQQEKVTIAFSGCKKSCEGNAFDYLWPILVDASTGQCF